MDGYTATFPGGTKVRYWTEGTTGSSSRHFPTSITDRHGNFISTVYKDTSGRLDYVRDTLSRYIRFHYDSSNKLVAVTVPGYGSGPNSQTSDPALDRQTIRFYYESLSLQYENRFDGTITVPYGGELQVLKYVYFPATNTGYKYDYSSSYGMIYRITSFRGMVASTNSLTTTGTITSDGQWAAWTKYNYPGTDTEPPSSTLSDMPKYNKRIDEWRGRTSDGNPPETYFNVVDETSTRTTTITTPDGAVSETIANRNTAAWNDGLITQTSLKDSSGNVFSKTAYTWEEGSTVWGRHNPRVKRTEVTNDAGLTKAIVLEYVDLNNVACAYNNVCQVKEHDYAAAGSNGTLLRNTVTTYETGASYINNGHLNLPKSVRVIAGGATVARTDYNYDTQSLFTYSNADIGEMYNISYNPATGSSQTYCEPGCSGTRQNCCFSIPGYDSTTGYRGNVTEVKQFADATNENDPLAKTDVMKYDNVGNLREATVSCCQQRKWTYSSANKYAWPVEVINGDASQLTTQATYDYNTGLTETTVDENNQTTDYQYESDTLRQKKTVYPNGGYVLTEYSDKLVSNPSDLVPGFVRTTTTLDANKSVQSYSYFDGRGFGFRSASETPDGWSISASEFDNSGRPVKSFNPFFASTPTGSPGGTAYTKILNYDTLGRATSVQLQDTTTVSTEFSTISTTPSGFNKTFVTVTDQAGKKRRQVADSLGRTVRVDEPDANGSLGAVASPNQPTYYEYDANDNLSKVTQSDGTVTQERLFKYDSLSRLTHERQVEANATLNDAGTKVTTGGLWTKVLTYNEDGLLTDAYDANGVHTAMQYDGLNRLKKVTYEGESGYETPDVDYYYDQARSGFHNIGALTKVTTAAVTGTQATPATETLYDYDLMGRLVKHVQTIGDQSYQLEYGYNLAGQLTSEKYPSGRIVTNGFDAKGRMTSVADADRTYLSGVTFGAATLPTQIALGNGTVQNFDFNERLQMKSQDLKRGTEVLQKYEYGFGELNPQSQLKNNGKLRA
ncbi:MAG: RHS repeat protein [Acidobacteria bacterium]|nr:RHS repeat protein [Acidobacteriota bacterium]